MKLLSDSDYNKLKKTPRFTHQAVTIFDHKIVMPDVASFFSVLPEIFDRKIYSFKAETDSPLIIDCGANIGLSVIFFKRLYPEAKIIAFEPDGNIFKYLKTNTESFELDNVTLVNKGLWHEKTTLSFYSEGADGGRIAGSAALGNKITIETVKLGEYLKGKEIDFLKIDIEGAECEVLSESAAYLGNVKNIFIEYHSFYDKPQTLSEILNVLKEAGFRYYVEHVGIKSLNPFDHLNTTVGFDNQLNIFGYRL